MRILSFDIGIKNLAYCLGEFHDSTVSIIDWGVECLYNSTSKSKIPLDKLNTLIIKFLDSKPDFLKASHVLIEQQPTKNPLMKNISVMVHSYFIIRGIVDKEFTKSSIEKISFFSPKNKLKVYDGPEIICNLKSRYSQRKKIGIIQTKFFIQKFNLDDYKDLFENSKKKDDLADSFLQALCYWTFKEFNSTKSGHFHKWKGPSRKPTKKQIENGNFNIPQLRHFFGILLRSGDIPETIDDLKQEFPEFSDNIISSIHKHIGNLPIKDIIAIL